jgi:hypothetical protein
VSGLHFDCQMTTLEFIKWLYESNMYSKTLIYRRRAPLLATDLPKYTDNIRITISVLLQVPEKNGARMQDLGLPRLYANSD